MSVACINKYYLPCLNLYILGGAPIIPSISSSSSVTEEISASLHNVSNTQQEIQSTANQLSKPFSSLMYNRQIMQICPKVNCQEKIVSIFISNKPFTDSFFEWEGEMTKLFMWFYKTARQNVRYLFVLRPKCWVKFYTSDHLSRHFYRNGKGHVSITIWVSWIWPLLHYRVWNLIMNVLHILDWLLSVLFIIVFEK